MPDRSPRRFLPLGLAATLALAAAVQAGARAQAPPPPPPSPNPSATPLPAATVTLSTPSPSPTPSPTPAPRRGRGRGRQAASPGPSTEPAATATPTSPAFATLDGTWEVQLQYSDHTDYSYFVLQQKDAVLSGMWRQGRSQLPLTGSYDGRLIHFVVKAQTGDVTFSGYVENGADMVGEADYGKKQVAFTAEHRGPPPRGLLRNTTPY